MKSGKKRQSSLQSRWAPAAFLAPGFLGVVIFVLFPFLDVFGRSFLSTVTGEFVGFSNYKMIFSNSAFRLALRNTCRFTAACLPLLIGLGFLIALLLVGKKRLRAVKSMLLFPMAMPAATVVLVWKMVFTEGGFLNQLLEIQTDFMNTEDAFWVLVFSYVWKNLGYTVVLWIAGILSVPYSLWEAAKADGAGYFKIVFKILLPNLKGVLYTITVLSFFKFVQGFPGGVSGCLGSYPHESMYLLQHLFNNWFVRLELDKMAAAAVCIGTVLFGVILMLQRLWDKEEEV